MLKALMAFFLVCAFGASFSASAQGLGGGRFRRHIPAHAVRRPIFVRPPVNSQLGEIQAAQATAEAFRGLQCERLGEALRRLSNQLRAQVTEPVRPVIRNGRRFWPRNDRSPLFWQGIWNRMAEAYRSCEVDCFEDGEAVGEISALAYCTASVELGGLTSPGLIRQERLPLCENAIFVGCQKGYFSAARSSPGCASYAGGAFEKIFQESMSQDCHVDPDLP